MESVGQNTGVEFAVLFSRGSCPQGDEPRVSPALEADSLQLDTQKSRILEWVAMHFSARSSDTGIELGSLHCRPEYYS